MIATPFLGDRYNYLMPGLMIVFSLIFIMLNICNLERGFIGMLRRYNNNRD